MFKNYEGNIETPLRSTNNHLEHMKMNIKFMIRKIQHHEDSNSP